VELVRLYSVHEWTNEGEERDMEAPTLPEIEETRARIAGKVHRTPMFTSATLGERIGAEVFLKAESFQKTGSFKARGAYNNIVQLTDDEKRRGVITVSAGNHAAAVAWAAKAAGVPATVVMAESANPTKVAACCGYGAEVVLHGPTSTEAFAEMYRLRDARNLTFIHPFDSSRTLAGTGTIGLEVLEDVPEVDTVVVGVGGGGLISGIASAIRQAKPSARVIGVEPTGADAMIRSLAAGRVVHLDRVETIADGLAPPFVGELPLAVVREYVEDVIPVTDDEIVAGMRFLLERCKLVAEPAGAAATAAVLLGNVPVRPGERVAVIVSGGNVDLPKLRDYLA
jgi:threonine ammonia-lyase medium form